jgi:hypothetical protein
MGTLAAIGAGFSLSSSTTSGGTYTPIAEIVDLKPGKTTVGKSEIARSDNTQIAVEKIPGWKDVSDWEGKCVYAKTYRAALEALVGVPMYWKFIRPDGTSSQAFQAFMSELGDEVPIKEFMSCDFKLTVSGLAPFTAGS